MTKKRILLIAPLTLGFALSLAACSQPAASPAASSPTQGAEEDALMGVWEMTALENNASGEFETVPFSGQIVFGSDTVSVQAMNPDTTAPDTAYTVQGYEAFYGDLTIDDGAGTWSVEVKSAAARDLIGQTLTRNFEVANDTLVLTPIDQSEGWRVTYERVSP